MGNSLQAIQYLPWRPDEWRSIGHGFALRKNSAGGRGSQPARRQLQMHQPASG
jgi:hypothetical protein